MRIRGWTTVLGLVLAAAGGGGAGRAAEPPILVLDAGGHTARVTKVLFTPDGKELITVSEDKTIRCWDVATGEPLRVLRPPIGPGPEGMLYAAAISPDGRTLAVGGFTAPSGSSNWPIYLLSLERGELLRRLEGHTEVVLDLAFSPDGRRLISGSGDNTARIWNVADGRCEQTLAGHAAAIYGVVFSPDGRQCATASLDKTAAIWSVADGKRTATLSGHTAEVGCIDWRGDRLVTGSFDHTIKLWSPAGKLLRTVDGLGRRIVTSVRFTPAGDRVLFGATDLTGAEKPHSLAGVVEAATGKLLTRCDRHTSTIYDVRLSPDGTRAASTGGNDQETLLWRVADGAVTQTFVGRGRTPWAAAWNRTGDTIAWGETNVGSTLEADTPLERSFTVSRLEFGPAVTAATAGEWRRAQFTRGSLTLEPAGETSVAVRQGDRTVATLQPTSVYNRQYDWVRCFTLLPGDRAAVGSNFALRLYDTRRGDLLRECVGHSGIIWGVAPSPDGRYLLSAASDMTLRIWPLQAGGDGPIFPHLNLFFAGDDWIAWTPEGYYAASPGGERLMGWHVNNGPDQLASFYPAAQFRKQFYRPDVIKRLLQTGSVERALEEAGSREQVTDVARNLPPRVEIVTPAGPQVVTDQSELQVTVAATQVGAQPVTSLQLLLNGRPLGGQGGIVRLDGTAPSPRHTFTVPLISGVTHRLQARADSAVSYGLSPEVEVTVKSSTPSGEDLLPALYVLAIGVADYDDAGLRLNFAAGDARRLAGAFESHSRGLYRKVEMHVLTDKQATQRGILSGLGWLKKQMTQRDVGVVFFSGHGERDEHANFYLLPSDVDREDLLVTGVPDAQVKQILQGIPGRVLVILDACHAGTLGGDRRKTISGLTDDLVRDLATDDFGIVTMASSLGREFSLENAAEKSGLFTLALTEGLSGKADFNRDGVVYFNELDAYVSERVKELSQGRQHPVTARPATVRSFPLSRAAAAP